MSNGLILLIVSMLMIPTVTLTTVIPLLTRRIESFGVTIPEAGQRHERISALRRQYLWWSGSLGVAVTASLMLLSRGQESDGAWTVVFISHLFGYLLASFAIYVKQHYAVKRLKQSEGWMTDALQRTVVSVTFRNEKLTYSSYWFIPHALLVIATVMIGVFGYDKFPDPLPMQYGFDGEVTRSVAKSYTAVLWPVWVQIFLLVTFVFVNYVIGRSKQIVEAGDPEGSLKRNIKFRRVWSGFMIVLGLLIIALMGLFPLSLLFGWGPSVIASVTVGTVGVIVIGSIVLSVKTGQGGSRIRLEGGKAGATVLTGDQDRYWKLGQFYFNPDDPALFVEKRFGIGWTMNFAKPIVWVILLLIVACPIVIPLFVMR